MTFVSAIQNNHLLNGKGWGGRGECAQGVELFDPFPFVVCIIHGVSVVVKVIRMVVNPRL